MSSSTDSGQPRFPARRGVLVRARNGDVIQYDSTGLLMRLSDRVIDDIRTRLGVRGADGGIGAQSAPLSADALTEAEAALEAVDSWDLTVEGDWLRFSARLPGRQGVRRYRRNRSGGGIVAETAGPLFGIFGIGGARAGLASPGPSAFPFHVLGAADDIGAVGQSGVDRAAETAALDQLRELTHEALVAETCLGWQMDKHGPLPLFVARVETDGSASAVDLAAGAAMGNLMIAADNLCRAAESLGKKPKLLAVALDFTLEDIASSAEGYRDAMIALMARIEEGMAARGLERPLFVIRFDTGAPGDATDAQIRGQWELAWNCGNHRLVVSAPGYMFETDEHARPTAASRRRMAEMTAAAVTAASARPLTVEPLTDGWRCPVFHLAEVEPGPEGGTVIRMIAQASSALVLEREARPDGAEGQAPGVGFALRGVTNGARITAVSIDPDDGQTILLHLNRAPEGEGMAVSYGCDLAEPAAQVAVRDDWQLASADGGVLRRWALPCLLPLHPGRMAE